MKKIFVLLFVCVSAIGMMAHAAEGNAPITTTQKQIAKLRSQAATAHKKGDALTAKADKLEAQPTTQPGEKMRSASDPSDGASTKTSCVPHCPVPKNKSLGIRG